MSHHRDALARFDAQIVEPGGNRGGMPVHFSIGQAAPSRCWLIGFVDEGNPIWVHLRGPAEEVIDSESNFHVGDNSAGRTRR